MMTHSCPMVDCMLGTSGMLDWTRACSPGYRGCSYVAMGGDRAGSRSLVDVLPWVNEAT